MTMYRAYVGIIGDDKEKEKVIKICEDIKKKDATFKYRIAPSFGALKDKFKYNLVLYDEDKKSLEKRAGWFVHKCTGAKFAELFKVKECRIY